MSPFRKIIASILMLATFIPPVAAAPMTDWSSVIDRVLKSVVFVESNEGSCTGFVISTERKLVQSAAHCDADGKVWIDRVLGELVSNDTKQDMAVYAVKHLDPNHVALQLASKDPVVGEEVVSVGYGMGLERPIARKAMVSDTALTIPNVMGGPFIALDSAFVGGQSGGPVVNKNGEVVMIVQRASNTVGIGVGAETIKLRTGRFWGK